MRVVIQRVKNASVTVEEKIVGKIRQGYLLLVAFADFDDEATVEKLAEKIKNLRVFSDSAGKMNLSLEEVQGEVLSVSQFTLYADLTTGRRPSFLQSAKAEKARVLYEYFNKCLVALGLKVETGLFQAEMLVKLENDGPVTVILDSEDFK